MMESKKINFLPSFIDRKTYPFPKSHLYSGWLSLCIHRKREVDVSKRSNIKVLKFKVDYGYYENKYLH